MIYGRILGSIIAIWRIISSDSGCSICWLPGVRFRARLYRQSNPHHLPVRFAFIAASAVQVRQKLVGRNSLNRHATHYIVTAQSNQSLFLHVAFMQCTALSLVYIVFDKRGISSCRSLVLAGTGIASVTGAQRKRNYRDRRNREDFFHLGTIFMKVRKIVSKKRTGNLVM